MSRIRISVPEWSLRRKLALTLAIPMVLAGVLGGLRVWSELEEARNFSASAEQVTVLRPAVEFLAAAEHAAVVARGAALDDPDRATAVRRVDAAAGRLEQAAATAPLTAAQREQVDSVLELGDQLRDGRAYVSLGQSVSQVRQLHRGVSGLVATVVDAQLEPAPELRTLGHALDGRLSLSMQQLLVAYGDGDGVNPVELAAEVGVEAAAVERLGVALGATDPTVLALKQQNALHFGTVRDGGTDLGGPEAYAGYDEVTTELLGTLDRDLATAAGQSRTFVIVNAATTLVALLAAVLLALLVSRLLLGPIHRVRDGALEVARVRLPEAVGRIRDGQDPGEIEPLAVDTHEEMGQLARAVDDLHRQALVLATGEAQLRSRVSDMFVTLSRRNTSLINQQLALIETLERDEEDPGRLESLFRLDHLASRMRRTADSLLVLAEAPARGGDATGLTVADALQAACAGVQEYERVQLLASPEDPVSPSAAADVVHLLTELVDNALAYSPPTAAVLVLPSREGSSMRIDISDAGLGIPEEDLASLNADLGSGGEITPDTARRMGLLVVSRLARRHGIKVHLERNERNGTTATVVLPARLLSRAVSPVAPVDGPPPAPRPPARPPAEAGPSGSAPAATSTAAPEPPPRDQSPAPAPVASDGPALEQIEAAINAALGQPPRRPEPAPRPEPVPAPVRAVVPDPEPAAVAVLPALPVRLPAAVPEPAPEPEPVAPPAAAPVALAEAAPPAEAPRSRASEALDPGSPVVDAEDDSPIFRALRSHWLTADGAGATGWTSPEIDAGWEAADRSVTPATTQLSEAGLPMRRPGNRLVPGGVTSTSTTVSRDPEAIRARLAAHSAGVARGRREAEATTPPETPGQEATPEAPRQEAGTP